MPAPDAAQRLADNVQALLDAQKDTPRPLRKTQRGLALALKLDPATVNQALARRAGQAFRLVQLDAIADYFGVTPASLIRWPTSAMWELTQAEARLVRHWRTWATEVQQQVMGLLDFVAGLLPEEKEDRRLFQKWRRLTPPDRAYAERTIDDLLRAEARDRISARDSKDRVARQDRPDENRTPTRGRPRRAGTK
jgi:hypothetical protein